MIDVNTLIQAGFDPKTLLPRKLAGYDGLEYNLKPNIRKTLRIMDEQNAVNRFVWHNLPSGLTGQIAERILYYKGQAAFFYLPTQKQFYFLPYALDGTIDVYGRYLGITPLPFAGGKTSGDKGDKPWITGLTKKPVYDVILPEDLTLEDFEDSAVLLYDYTPQYSQTVIPRAELQDALIDIMSDCLPFARTALLNSTGVEGIRVGNEDEQSNVDAASRSINKAALYGQKFIPIIGSLDFQPLTNGSTGSAQDFLLVMQAVDNLRLANYGLQSGGILQKKEHMLQSEYDLNSGNVGLVMQDGLTLRQRFCDIVNSIWGIGIWCEVSETASGMDKDQDGEVSDNFDQSGTEEGQQSIEDKEVAEE